MKCEEAAETKNTCIGCNGTPLSPPTSNTTVTKNTSDTGAKKAIRAATGPVFNNFGMSMPIDGTASTSG